MSVHIQNQIKLQLILEDKEVDYCYQYRSVSNNVVHEPFGFVHDF